MIGFLLQPIEPFGIHITNTTSSTSKEGVESGEYSMLSKIVKVGMMSLAVGVVSCGATLEADSDYFARGFEGTSENVKALARASCKGDVDDIKQLILEGAEINVRGAFLSPLHYAIKCQSKEGVSALLRQGADPNFIAYRDTPIITAANFPDVEILKLLVDNGAEVNGYNPDFGDLAINAAYWQYQMTDNRRPYDYLLGQGADIHLKPNAMNAASHVEFLVSVSGNFELALDYVKTGYRTDLKELRERAAVSSAFDRQKPFKNELLALLDKLTLE